MKMTKEQEQGFIQFWTFWQKRVAKADAMKAWMNINPKEYAAIFAAVPVHFQQQSWKDHTYVPYPASWLRGRRWEDEIAIQSSALSPSTAATRAADKVIEALKDPQSTMPTTDEKTRTALYTMLTKNKSTWPRLRCHLKEEVVQEADIRAEFLREYNSPSSRT